MWCAMCSMPFGIETFAMRKVYSTVQLLLHSIVFSPEFRCFKLNEWKHFYKNIHIPKAIVFLDAFFSLAPEYDINNNECFTFSLDFTVFWLRFHLHRDKESQVIMRWAQKFSQEFTMTLWLLFHSSQWSTEKKWHKKWIIDATFRISESSTN